MILVSLVILRIQTTFLIEFRFSSRFSMFQGHKYLEIKMLTITMRNSSGKPGQARGSGL